MIPNTFLVGMPHISEFQYIGDTEKVFRLSETPLFTRADALAYRHRSEATRLYEAP